MSKLSIRRLIATAATGTIAAAGLAALSAGPAAAATSAHCSFVALESEAGVSTAQGFSCTTITGSGGPYTLTSNRGSITVDGVRVDNLTTPVQCTSGAFVAGNFAGTDCGPA